MAITGSSFDWAYQGRSTLLACPGGNSRSLVSRYHSSEDSGHLQHSGGAVPKSTVSGSPLPSHSPNHYFFFPLSLFFLFDFYYLLTESGGGCPLEVIPC